MWFPLKWYHFCFFNDFVRCFMISICILRLLIRKKRRKKNTQQQQDERRSGWNRSWKLVFWSSICLCWIRAELFDYLWSLVSLVASHCNYVVSYNLHISFFYCFILVFDWFRLQQSNGLVALILYPPMLLHARMNGRLFRCVRLNFEVSKLQKLYVLKWRHRNYT